MSDLKINVHLWNVRFLKKCHVYQNQFQNIKRQVTYNFYFNLHEIDFTNILVPSMFLKTYLKININCFKCVKSKKLSQNGNYRFYVHNNLIFLF